MLVALRFVLFSNMALYFPSEETFLGYQYDFIRRAFAEFLTGEGYKPISDFETNNNIKYSEYAEISMLDPEDDELSDAYDYYDDYDDHENEKL